MFYRTRTLPQKAARLGILLCSAVPLAALCTLVWANPPYPVSGFLLGTFTWTAILYLAWVLRQLLMRLAFPVRLPSALVGLGRERQTLYQAALGIHWGREDQAVTMLDRLTKAEQPEVRDTALIWRAIAAMRCFRRRRRLPLGFECNYPELFVLLFGAGEMPWHFSRHRLKEEIARVSAAELDELARVYMQTMDFTLASRVNRRSAFASIAYDITEYLSGCGFIFFPLRRTMAWWSGVKSVLNRGGGPLLAGVRLIERGFWEESAALLGRLQQDGLLSEECESAHRLAVFLSSHPPWRLGADEVSHMFRDQFYCAWQDTGLLRLPLAESAEIAVWCRRGRELREAKQAFIGSLLKLWAVLGTPMDAPMSAALEKLTGCRGRRRSTRYRAWRSYWDQNERFFEPSVVLVMEGIAAAVAGQSIKALRQFELAHKIDGSDSTSLINQVYMLAVIEDEDAMRARSIEVLKRFPKDVGALMSLGQIFAMRLRDYDMADRLSLRAHQLCPESAEPLLLRAELALLEGHYAESEKFFSQALRTDPSSIEARLGLGRVHLETRRPDLAVQHLLSASQEGQGELQNQADYLLYRSFRDLNADHRAIEYLERIPPQFFREPDELDDIAFHLESEKHYGKARMYAERAMILRARGKGRDGKGDELRPT